MISGGYNGGLSFYKGVGHGKYAERVRLTKSDGSALTEDNALAPSLADWDGDGDLDIVMGAIEGPVKVYLNSGNMTFSAGQELRSAGQPIRANDGGPCVVDWDGDGKLDLLLGDERGQVVFYRGMPGTEFAPGEVLVPALPADKMFKPRAADPGNVIPFKPKAPGVRTKPFATDWNGDGKLDLLVGDFVEIDPPKRGKAKRLMTGLVWVYLRK